MKKIMSENFEAKVIMTLKKTTKGTHVYANEDKGFSGVYIPKELLPADAPQTIMLTLSQVN